MPYPSQHWLIVNWSLWSKFQWNLTQVAQFVIHGNAFENVVCEMAAILCRGRWLNRTWCHYFQTQQKFYEYSKAAYRQRSIVLTGKGRSLKPSSICQDNIDFRGSPGASLWCCIVSETKKELQGKALNYLTHLMCHISDVWSEYWELTMIGLKRSPCVIHDFFHLDSCLGA